MILSFSHQSSAQRIVFAAGAIDRVPTEVEQLGIRRALVIGGDATLALAERVSRDLGTRSVGLFSDVVQHVPAHQVDKAVLASRKWLADGVVTVGGGSTTGLGKVVALERELPLLAVPTTYAGSEMTPIHGVTRAGRKVTGVDARVLPRTVVYDPELTLTMPPHFTASSGMNSLAHCVEALWLGDATPFATAYAQAGIRHLLGGLGRTIARPDDLDARAMALLGACFAGAALGLGGTGLHHRICHVLGGTYGLDHSAVHSAVLPQVVAYNVAASAEVLATLRGSFDHDDPAGAIFELATSIGAPVNLAALGFRKDDVGAAAVEVASSRPPNPASVTVEAVRAILDAALAGVDRTAGSEAEPRRRGRVGGDARMAGLRFEELFTLCLRVDRPLDVGVTPVGARRLVGVLGGSFSGELLSGIVLPGGSDWITIRPDGVLQQDVRICLRTDDGAAILMTYRGLRHGPEEVMERLSSAEVVDPSEYYFRTAPVFETASEKYAWLNRTIAVAVGDRRPDTVEYKVYRVL